MENLCNSCRLAKWDLNSAENAYCEEIPSFKVIGEDNYVNSCTNYKPHLIKVIVNLFKKYVLNQ